MRQAIVLVALLALILQGCASSRPPKMKEGAMSGLASWYGEEYAGRLTANGEIFDPSKLTAAHRTLPFGTIVKVTNPKTGKSVNVRINDRGPFIAGRIIDLSYAAAAAIGLVADGVAPVDLSIVRLGGGASEAPKPLVVEIPPSGSRPAPPPVPTQAAPSPPTAQPSVSAPAATVATPAPKTSPTPASNSPAAKAMEAEAAPSPPAPTVPFPIPQTTEPTPSPTPTAAPATPEPAPRSTTSAPPAPEQAQPAPAHETSTAGEAGRRTWSLQLGAFGSEENARKLRDRAAAITPHVNVVKIGGLYRVRVGPFTSEVSAIEMRERFDSAGFKTYLISN